MFAYVLGYTVYIRNRNTRIKRTKNNNFRYTTMQYNKCILRLQ